MKWFVRRGHGRIVGSVNAKTSEEAIEMARGRFSRAPWPLGIPQRELQVFNNNAPPPDSRESDEGRRWWMERGY